MSNKEENKDLVFSLKGRIDTSNSASTEEEIRKECESSSFEQLVLDCENLEYISSAGLRVLLRLKKDYPQIRCINVSSEVYEIFDMTGFTEMLKIERAYKRLSVEGCEIIGEGAKGRVYRLDAETCVKTYFNPDSLAEIQHEREVARRALILGIPTAISYDVAKVGNSYASVFELLNAKNFSKLIEEDSEHIDRYVGLYVELLKKIHSTEAKEGDMPKQKDEAMGWAQWAKDYFHNDLGDRIYELFSEVPDSNFLLHGDYHTKNLMYQNDEVLLIDMDTLAVGNPVFELGSIYQTFVAYNEVNPNNSMEFLGMSRDTSEYIWKKALPLYLETDNARKLRETENKAKVVAYTRLLRKLVRKEPDKVEGIKHCEKMLEEIVPLVKKLAV